jgi:hypothetical protein
MSIEKELLKRMRDVLRGLEETHYDLYWDIQSELNKPDLKRESLSDEEMQTSSYFICCANQSTKLPEHFKVPHSIYVYVKQLEYQIEKTHGIGEGND